MPRYGVNLISDLYYEIEADDQDDAINAAFEFAWVERGIEWDCNECIELDGE